MKRGYLTSGRDAVYFSEEKPGMVEYLIRGAGWLRLANEGGSVNTYKTAWHCPACRKLVGYRRYPPQGGMAGTGTDR